MKSFFKSRIFKILFALAVVLLAGIIAAASLGSRTSPVTKAVSTIFSPLSRVSTYITDKLSNIRGGFISSSSYMQRVSELEKQVADYQSKLVDYEKLKKQVESYEKFLDIKEKNPDYKFTSGSVIGRDSADLFYSFELNCGAKDGVSVNDPVISGEYLVGLVSKTTPTTCTVLTVIDPKVNTAAYEIKTGELGYTDTNAKSGTESVIKFSGLTKDTAIAEGGIVCTSGVGGIFPRGLIIGTVTSVKPEESDVSYYAEVKPQIDFNEIQDAFVITDFEGKGDA